MFTIVAVLFIGQTVHTAYETPQGEVQRFVVQNNPAGAEELAEHLKPVLKRAPGKPLVCMNAVEGTDLHGPVFERTVFDELVRRFMYAKPKYYIEAQAKGISPEDPASLLAICYESFPPIARVRR